MLLALGVASAGAMSLAVVLLVLAVGRGFSARRWVGLAERSRVGARSEDEVRHQLASLERLRWRVRHSLPWRGPGDIDSVAIAPSGVVFAIETKTRTYKRPPVGRHTATGGVAVRASVRRQLGPPLKRSSQDYSAGVFDFGAYFDRIGLQGRPTIRDVHRAHITSIPFENLDPHRGVPVSLAPEDLERKLVHARRGGYCFEQNLLLKAGLEALGAEVDLFLARVRFGAEPGMIRPRTHLVLGVHAEGGTWHADVGFGSAGVLEPIPFGPDGVYEQSGWRFRVVEDGPEWVLQLGQEDDWIDLYGFIPQPVPLVDVETSNWFTSTHPSSRFVTGLIAGLRDRDGALTQLSDWSGPLLLTERTPAQTNITEVPRDSVPNILAARLALPGFRLNSNGGLVLADS